MIPTKTRKVGLWSSVAAVAAFGLTAIANDRHLGFGYVVSRRHQLALLAAAITLCVMQLALYLSAHRKENNGK